MRIGDRGCDHRTRDRLAAGVVNSGVGAPPLATVEVPAALVTPHAAGLVLVRSKRHTLPSRSPA